MRGSVLRSYLMAAFSGLACALPALAQTLPAPIVERPTFFVWCDGIPCGVVPTQSTFMTAMPKRYLVANESGADAADRVADYILQHTSTSAWSPLNNPPDTSCHGLDGQDQPLEHAPDLVPVFSNLTSNNICISLQNFGIDGGGIDVPNTTHPELDWTQSPLRLYTEEDRLHNYLYAGSGPFPTDNSSFDFPITITFDSDNPQAWLSNAN